MKPDFDGFPSPEDAWREWWADWTDALGFLAVGILVWWWNRKEGR